MNQLNSQIYDAGIVGAGGAGFPTHVKMNGNIKTLIINGAECEPLLQVDKALLTAYTCELIECVEYVMKEMSIENCIIGIKNKNSEIINSIDELIVDKKMIKVYPLPSIYPIGDEVVLIEEVTGIVLKRSELPISKGLLVINTETLLNIYKKVFCCSNVTHSYVTITGEVEKQGIYSLPIGMELKEILKTIGIPRVKDYRVIVGGPMTGTLASSHEVVRKNTKGFIILPADHHLITNMEDVNEVHLKRIMASCSQCRACTDMCPRELLGHEVKPHQLMNAMANGMTGDVSVFKTALGCVNCGVCELYACHHDLSPRKMMVAVKKAYALEGVRPSSEGCKEIHRDRDYRRIPSKRLTMHLHLTKYDHPIDNIHLEPKEVNQVIIPVNQHIGAPSKVIVKIGDKVMVNQRIAENLEGNLGAHIHASISGIVRKIDEAGITIERVG